MNDLFVSSISFFLIAARPIDQSVYVRFRDGPDRDAALQVPNVRNIIVRLLLARPGSLGITGLLPRTVSHLRLSRRSACAFSRVARLRGRPFSSMPLHVKRQMVASRERSLTEMALERLLARVLAIVPRQLV